MCKDNCFKCTKPDCTYNGIRSDDRKEIKSRDKRMKQGDCSSSLPWARRKNRKVLR